MAEVNITIGKKIEGIPTCQTLGSINSNIVTPYGNDIFSKTYYKVYNGKITAFKVLAWAVTDGFGKLTYLVLFPNGTTEWKVEFLNDAQLSVEDIVNCKEAHYYNLFRCVMACNGGVFRTFCDRYTDCMYFYNSYEMVGNKVVKHISGIHQIYGTPDGVFVRLFHNKPNYFNSEEECKINKFNGMEVVDFADPIKIEIEVGGEVKKKIKLVD